MTRPKVPRPYTRTERVQTTLRPDEKQWLDAYAAGRVSSVADALRELVLDAREGSQIGRGRR